MSHYEEDAYEDVVELFRQRPELAEDEQLVGAVGEYVEQLAQQAGDPSLVLDPYVVEHAFDAVRGDPYAEEPAPDRHAEEYEDRISQVTEDLGRDPNNEDDRIAASIVNENLPDEPSIFTN